MIRTVSISTMFSFHCLESKYSTNLCVNFFLVATVLFLLYHSSSLKRTLKNIQNAKICFKGFQQEYLIFISIKWMNCELKKAKNYWKSFRICDCLCVRVSVCVCVCLFCGVWISNSETYFDLFNFSNKIK